jgi:hypothetical protein
LTRSTRPDLIDLLDPIDLPHSPVYNDLGPAVLVLARRFA